VSKAKQIFDYAIKDAEILLQFFDENNKNSPPENTEVFKRAGLIMALTAWETYVEDRVREEMTARLRIVEGSPLGKFVIRRLEEELKRFNNPNSERTKRIFLDYAEVDVVSKWEWAQCDSAKAKKTLDELIAKRGDAVHRSKSPTNGNPSPHLIKRDELEKAIKFLKTLVEVTDKILEE
jgi:hypothetical protein